MMDRRAFIICAFMFSYALIQPSIATAEGLSRDTMEAACSSKLKSLTDLCALVKREFGYEQDEFVQIDKDIYLVAVSQTGTIGQGMYAANIAAQKMAMFGGYGAPTFGTSFTDSNGVTYLKVSYVVPPRHGKWGEGENLLQIRTNPITGKKYIIEQRVTDKLFFSEENGKPDETVVYGNVPVPGKRKVLGKAFVEKIAATHRAALDCYKAEKARKPRKGQPFSIMEKAGIWAMIDQRPPEMAQSQYVSIMNDYAFFAYQYGEGRTDLAIEILHKVIGLNPRRTPAYLNIADALDYAAKYQCIPLGDKEVEQLRYAAKEYRAIYEQQKLQKQL